jgi:predicted ATPase
MAQQPFLKSIRPVNLLSFGPDTKEIELRPLNILIGPNGCGKSNLIEIIGLLRSLTDKKPWAHITETSGLSEWIWKNPKQDRSSTSSTKSMLDVVSEIHQDEEQEIGYLYRIELNAYERSTTVSVGHEAIIPFPIPSGELKPQSELWRENDIVVFPQLGDADSNALSPGLPLMPSSSSVKVTDQISALSQLLGIAGPAHIMQSIFERMAIYRNWTFGYWAKSRTLERVGMETTYLEEDSSNLAHVLNFILTHQNHEPGEKLREAFRAFSDDAKDIETRFQEGYVQLRIRESSGISTPASRLSDGTLRWLALLTILLNPSPAPVICIDEPELGLHPDILPTLADLLRDASRRTQLIVTTHSQSLVECFSDDPESVCVCEKVEGATQIRRLSKETLSSWLEDYSLGQLWAKGEIGGNRW